MNAAEQRAARLWQAYKRVDSGRVAEREKAFRDWQHAKGDRRIRPQYFANVGK